MLGHAINAAVDIVLSATGLMLTWAAVTAWVLRRPHSRLARRAIAAATIGFFAATTYVVPAAGARVWNTGFREFGRADVGAASRVAVVILGAGAETAVGWESTLSTMSAVAAARVLEAIRVYRAIEPAFVISSGGRPDPGDIATPAAFLMRDALVGARIPAARIVTEATSRDTHDEAVLLAPILRGLGVDRVVLVTSDVHMRRSLGAFRAVGVDAVPAIAPDPGLARRWPQWVVPSDHGLAFTSQLFHEVLALPYYWARGWWR